jgi:hypothetical protein
MGKKVLHGAGHDWELKGDIVEARTADNRVASFERWWRCGSCPDFRRHRTYTLIPQYSKGPLGYQGKATPMDERFTPESEDVAEVLQTTDNSEIKRTLRGLGYR